MMVWAMQQLNLPVSYSVGTTLPFGPSGKFDPSSQYFIYECDEYDRNFLQFNPALSLLTSVDYDHPDTYPTEAEYTAAFQQFISQSQQTILWQNDADYIGTVPDNSWVLHETLNLPLPGAHNRRNATLVLKGLEYLGLAKAEAAATAISGFPGTDRRFERLSENLYSDYGHHPKEIAATLQLSHELSDHVVLVYQPHQNRRQHRVKDLYRDQFELAEKVLWLPTYLSREDPDEAILSPEELTENITNKQAVTVVDLNDALWDQIQTARSNGALVLAMGAGTIDAWIRERLTASS